MSNRAVVMVDLDDTLFDTNHRAHLMPAGLGSPDKADWDAYHLACTNDAPIQWTINLARYYSTIYNVHIVSGRGTVAWSETVSILARYDIPYAGLHMRLRGDPTKNPVFKRNVAESIMDVFDTVIAFAMDDHPGVALELGKIGIPTLVVQRPESKNFGMVGAF